MADTDLQAESACANPANIEDFYRAWRFAKSAWDVAIYAPELKGEDLPEEVLNPLIEAEADAFERLMRAPCQTPGDLSRKLEVFPDEDGRSLVDGAIYMAIFAQDARKLHLGQR